MLESMRFLHLLFALSLFAGLGASMALAPLVRNLVNSGHLAPVISAIERNLKVVAIPSGVLTVVFGYAAAESGRWQVFSEAWLYLSLIAAITLIALNAFVVYPHFRSIGEALARQPVPDAELLSRIRRPLIRHIGLGQMITLLVITYLMIYKPF